MKIRRLRLKNWCQHKDAVYQLDNGIVGIVGPNGSGKSNILKAILFALTGYTLGTRIESLNYEAKNGEVELDFFVEEESATYRVVRNIHNGDVVLYRLNGDDFECISDRSATARDLLLELVPMPPDVAEQIYAVSQEDVVSLLKMTSSKRSEIMQRVFSLMFFNKIHRKLKELLNQVDDSAKSLEAQLLLLKDQESAAIAKVTGLSDVPPKEALDSLLKSFSASYEEMASKAGALTLRDYLEKEIQRSEDALSDMMAEYSGMQPPECPCNHTADEIREMLSQHREDHSKAEQIIKMFNGYFQIPAPEPFDQVQYEYCIDQRTSRILEAGEATTLLEHIRKCGTDGVCPVCGGKVSYTEEDLQKAEEDCFLKDEAVREASELVNSMEATLQNNKWNDQRRLEFAEKIRGAIREYGYDTVDEETQVVFIEWKEKIEKAIAFWNGRLDQRIHYDKVLSTYESKLEFQRSSIETLQHNLNAMRTNAVMTMDLSGYSIEYYEDEKHRLSSEIENIRKQQLQRVQLDSAQVELNGIRSDISRVSGLLRDTKPELREKLWKVQELFHPKELPTKVAFAIYKKLEGLLNIYLAEFEAPYKVEMKENGDFDCVFSSGLHQLAARLSGGQKMVLAIAFRLALHSVFATDDTGGFIALDEPTTFLDEHNRDSLFSVLNTLKTSPMFRDLQIFVVTHDDMLRPLFNCLVDLGKEG